MPLLSRIRCTLYLTRVCLCVRVLAQRYFTLPARHVNQISSCYARGGSLMNLSRVGIPLHIRPVSGAGRQAGKDMRPLLLLF